MVQTLLKFTTVDEITKGSGYRQCSVRRLERKGGMSEKKGPVKQGEQTEKRACSSGRQDKNLSSRREYSDAPNAIHPPQSW